MPNRFDTRFFDWIGHRNNARGASVDRDEHRRLSLLLHLARFRFERLNSTHILCAQKLRLADEHFASIHFADHTAAGG